MTDASLASSRLDTIRAAAEAAGADGAIVSRLNDIRWAIGFTGSNGLLVVTPLGAYFVTDGRYDEQARREVTGAEVHIPGYDLWGHIAERGWLEAQRIAFQSDHLTVAQHVRLGELFAGVEWVGAKELLVEAVAAKTTAEIDRVRRAQAITCSVLESIMPLLQNNISETKIAYELTKRHLQAGAERMAFDPIVGSGPNGALPHARAGDRELQSGDLVVIDVGGVFDGYASDLTRTIAIGEPGDAARDAYAAVLRAQEAAITGARAGVTGTHLDTLARDVLREHDLATYFSHSLGHGVGLDVHEWPRLSQAVEHVLPEGATVTIEPGVYLPGEFGIRIEDIIAVKEGGCENLTPLSKDLLVV
ncbi:MAG: aminopeptidase P family protein [Bacteroidota bacterium]